MTVYVDDRPCVSTKPHRPHSFDVTTQVPYRCPGIKRDGTRAGRTPSRRHGLGRSGVDALLAEQGGSCAICGVPYADVPGQRLAMDHDHRHHPGRMGCPECVRGMTCNRCNNILRLAQDDPTVLRQAIAYLDRWEQKRATERDW